MPSVLQPSKLLGPNMEKPKVIDNWSEAITLEEWMRNMILSGHPEIVKLLMKTLPESKKEKYRQIWKEMSEKKNVAKTEG